MGDSPPPFIVFRKKTVTSEDSRKPEAVKPDLYQLALDFTANVEQVLQKVDARFYLKDRLDKNAMAIAMHVGQGVKDAAPSGRRKSFTTAYKLAVDCTTILDILARRSDVDLVVVSAAQGLLSQLVSNLDSLRG